MALKNYRLKIAYDGTRLFGWERQPGKDTVQGKLENVLSRMTGTEVEVTGAGRTDAGVHARAMIANVHMDAKEMECDEIRDYMNLYLSDDIAVTSVSECSERFHARYNAKSRSYLYTIFDGPVKPVFNRKYYTRLDSPLDVSLMQEGAKFLLGEHDFKSFCGNPKMKKSTVRNIEKLDIRRSKGYVYINIKGSGFLQHMVRIIAGTLIEVGQKKLEPSKVKEILEARDRSLAGPTADAKGLTFMSVEY